jgi:hypothetical protein
MRDTQVKDLDSAGTKPTWALRFRRLLLHRRATLVVALIGFLLVLPTLSYGYFLDDNFHIYVLRGGEMPGGPQGVWDLYRFSSGTAEGVAAKASGVFPWWTSEGLRLGFMRPIPSLWRALDHRLFGESAVIPHLQVCIVFAGLVAAVARMLRSFFGDGEAGRAAAVLGALAFAVDDAHALNVAWIANRYSLISALFGALSLVAFASSRRAAQLSSPLLFLVAMLCGETSLSFVGFYLALVWLRGREQWKPLAVRLLPHAFVLTGWAVLYKLGGYGARGSGFYVDPLHDPLLFAGRSLLRLPVLLNSQLTFAPAEITGGLPLAGQVIAAIVAAVLALLVLRWIDRTCNGERSVRALVAGSLLSLVPVTATAADDRLLLIPGIGLLGALGMALTRRWSAPISSPIEAGQAVQRRSFTAGALVFIHLILAPLLFVPRQSFFKNLLQGYVDRHAVQLPHDAAVAEQHLIILATPDPLLSNYMLLSQLMVDQPHPLSAMLLTVGCPGPLKVERVGERELLLSADNLLSGPFARLYRATPLQEGAEIEAGVLSARVMRVEGDQVKQVRFRFDAPFTSLRWLVFGEGGYREVAPPALGESVEYEGWDFARALAQ